METFLSVIIGIGSLAAMVGLVTWGIQESMRQRKIQAMWDRIPWKRVRTKVVGKGYWIRGGPPALASYTVDYLDVVIEGRLDKPGVDSKTWKEATVGDKVLVEYKIHPDHPGTIGPSRVVKLYQKKSPP